MQIPYLFYSKPLNKSFFHACCFFPHKLELSMKVFAQACVEKYRAQHKNAKLFFDANKDKEFAPYRMKIH